MYAGHMATFIDPSDGEGGFALAYWRPGTSVAVVRWRDRDGEHQRTVTDEGSCVDLLVALRTSPNVRIVGVVVS